MIALTALGAGVAMYAQDIMATLMVQAEARNRAHLAATLDCASWLATITTTTVSVSALLGGSWALKIAVVACVSAANYGGTWTGVTLGKRFIRHKEGE